MHDTQISERLIRELTQRVEGNDVVTFFEREAARISRGVDPSFAFMDISPSLVACVGDGIDWIRNGPTIAVGFPFPLLTRSAGFISGGAGTTAGLAFHMDALHTILRREFLDRLSMEGVTTRLVDQDEFIRVKEMELSVSFDLRVQVDPFRFAGDSIAYGDAVAPLIGRTDASESMLLTVNPTMDGISGFRAVLATKIAAEIIHRASINGAKRVLVLLPNFIDDQWALVSDIVLGLVNKIAQLTVLIPGRQIIVCSRPFDSLAYHLSTSSDPSLWVMPRDIVVARALASFISGTNSIEEIPSLVRSTPRIFVHGCTSVARKDIPPSLTLAILTEIQYSMGVQVDLEVGTGITESIRHREWKMEVALGRDNGAHWRFVEDIRLADLDARIAAADFIIAADTAAAHIAYKYKKPTICIYNRTSWDARCVGSLFHHSAFGFAYQWPGFFVCITGPPKSERRELARSVTLLIDLISGRTELSLEIVEVIMAVSSRMELAVAQRTAYQAAIFELRLALRHLENSAVRDYPVLNTCLLWLVDYEEIRPALEHDFNTPMVCMELLRQFVQLHPATKLSKLIRAGRILIGHGSKLR